MDRNWRYTYGNYLRELCGRMELRDWSVTTSEVFCASDAVADVQVVRGKKEMQIRFSPGFEKRPRDENRSTCVHELLHVLLWGWRDAFYETQKNRPQTWLETLRWQCDVADEYAVSALADMIAPFMPLPPEVPMTAEDVERLLEVNGDGKGEDAAAVLGEHQEQEGGQTAGGQRAEEGPEAPDEKEVDRANLARLFAGVADYLLAHPLH